MNRIRVWLNGCEISEHDGEVVRRVRLEISDADIATGTVSIEQDRDIDHGIIRVVVTTQEQNST